MGIRLQKVIADNSEFSRRKAEELIAMGKVTVNGKVVTEMGIKVTEKDEILVDGNIIFQQDLVYFLIKTPMVFSKFLK